MISVVYFAQALHGGPIKIGTSSDPRGRLKSVQATLPFDLVEIGHIKGDLFRENFLKSWFAKDHIRSEWFKPSEELWRFAMEARTTGDISIVPPEQDFRKVDVKAVQRARAALGVSEEEFAKTARMHIRSLRTVEKNPFHISRKYLAAIAVMCVRHREAFHPLCFAYTAPIQEIHTERAA